MVPIIPSVTWTSPLCAVQLTYSDCMLLCLIWSLTDTNLWIRTIQTPTHEAPPTPLLLTSRFIHHSLPPSLGVALWASSLVPFSLFNIQFIFSCQGTEWGRSFFFFFPPELFSCVQSSLSPQGPWIMLRLVGEHWDNGSVNSLDVSIEDGVCHKRLYYTVWGCVCAQG